MARSRDYTQFADDLVRALQRGDMPGFYDSLRETFVTLDDMAAELQAVKQGSQTKASGGGSSATAQIQQGGSTASRVSAIPRVIANSSAFRKRFAPKVVENAKTTASDEQISGVNDPMTGYTLQTGRDTTGAVMLNMAVNWQNGALVPATAADVTLPCSGIVESYGNFTNQYEFRDGGLCYALIKLPIQSYSNRLYLSVTPGFLTTDPAEVGKVFNQEVGRFRRFINPNAWQAQDGSAIAEISFQYSPVS